jgi:hypothetical protein
MPITATETPAAIRRPALSSAAAAFLAKKYQMLIDGKWVDARSGQTFAVEDPATEEIIAHVPAGDKADIDLAVAHVTINKQLRLPRFLSVPQIVRYLMRNSEPLPHPRMG